MRILVLSDLHIEFEPFEAPLVNADVIVLAGDVHVGEKGLEWIKANLPDKPVLYVLGNHEYYGKAIPKLKQKLKVLAQNSNVHVLEHDSYSIGGVTFLGCTLWTDFDLFGNAEIAGYEATQRMTDFTKIRVSPRYSKMTSFDVVGFHRRSVHWLREEFEARKNEKLVVVTHHAPSMKSVPDQFREDLVSAAYASNMDELVAFSNARLWIHGHIHKSNDYHLGETRVLSNPRGYPDEPATDFNAGLIVEL